MYTNETKYLWIHLYQGPGVWYWYLEKKDGNRGVYIPVNMQHQATMVRYKIAALTILWYFYPFFSLLLLIFNYDK